MQTFGSLFSGGGGADIGLRAAGFTPVWAIEHDAAITEVYRANLGDHIITAGVEDVDPHTLEPVDLLWASPPCQSFSTARSKSLPARSDAEIGIDVLRYVSVLTPRVVMIENVPPYKESKACKALIAGLFTLGYFVHLENVNSADMGVPQTRRRLIIRAVRGGLVPPLPTPQAWIGWYEAIEDLLPILPESRFAEWQLKRLPELSEPTLVHATEMLSFTTRPSAEPSFTITGTHGVPRAFLIPGDNAANTTIRQAHEPMVTVQTRTPSQCPHRAWLEQGRVVQMTPRALARFQSFPDSYELPGNKALACRVIGNAVPPRLAERLVQGFID